MANISRYRVHKFYDEEERENFMKNVRRHIEKYAHTPKGPTSITEVTLTADEDDDVQFLVVRKEIRPGCLDPSWRVRMVPAEDAKDLERVIPEMRAKNLPPVNTEVTVQFPETDIASSRDYVIFSPKASLFLDQLEEMGTLTPQFDVVNYDVNQTRNRPVSSLALETQHGIEDTRTMKRDILNKKRGLHNRVQDAIRYTAGINSMHPSSTKSREIDTDHLFNYYKKLVRARRGREHEIVRENNNDIKSLEEEQHKISRAIDETEDVSTSVFRDTIDEGGMELPPNSITNTDDAIHRIGIGKRSFLRL